MALSWRAVMLLAGAAAAAGTCACDRSREVEAAGAGGARPAVAQDGAASAPPESATSRRLVTAGSGRPIRRVMRLESHLMVERDVGVMTRRDGVIESLKADRGDLVRQGQPLAILERKDLLLSEESAALELQQARATYDRMRRLMDEAIVPAEEHEQARLRRDAAEKSLERIRYELSKCVIEAPFDGVVSGRYVAQGQVIRQDDQKVLFQVTALGPLRARVFVPEWALAGLREGQDAGVLPTAAPAAAIPARVVWINDVVDAASATVEALVEIAPAAATRGLRPGMSVQVQLDLVAGGSAGGLVTLPREAFGPVEPEPGRRLALEVLAADGTAQARWVVVGFVGDDEVQVREGLAAGEQVVAP